MDRRGVGGAKAEVSLSAADSGAGSGAAGGLRLSQAQFARRFGFTLDTVQQYEQRAAASLRSGVDTASGDRGRSGSSRTRSQAAQGRVKQSSSCLCFRCSPRSCCDDRPKTAPDIRPVPMAYGNGGSGASRLTYSMSVRGEHVVFRRLETVVGAGPYTRKPTTRPST